MIDGCSSGEPINLFAVVAYLPEPLAGFVDSLRDELAPGCRLRAHLTILPPRQIAGDPELASQELRLVLQEVHSFQVSVGEVWVFPISDVVHIAVETGREQLRELHVRLNQGLSKAPELWRYHPHITLAQALEPSAVRPVSELATRRWREYSGPRSFSIDHLTFVRRTLETKVGGADTPWVDLTTLELLSPVLV
jgi:2'-5' RNA ligase